MAGLLCAGAPSVSGGFDVSAVAVVFDVFGFVAGAGGVHEDVQSLTGDADFLVGPLFADAVDDLSGEGVGDLPVVQAVVEVPAGEAVTSRSRPPVCTFEKVCWYRLDAGHRVGPVGGAYLG